MLWRHSSNSSCSSKVHRVSAMSEWMSLYKGGTGEIEEKKSRFIANIEPVTSVAQANEFIESIKKKYWDARHNCSAFVIGDNGENVRSSDDGEPSGTAGRPMLEVLTGEKITNVCVVVTRYFGGTLLGTGGLVRAYQGAVKEGLKKCSILQKIPGTVYEVGCGYNEFEKIRFGCSQRGDFILSIDYSDKVTMRILTRTGELSESLKEMINLHTSGKADISEGESVTFAIVDDNPMIF